MEINNLNQEKNIYLEETLANSGETALFEFDNNGKLSYVNNAGLSTLGIKTIKELDSSDIQNIFDFRITEIIAGLNKSPEIFKEIGIFDKSRIVYPTNTVFYKTNNGLIALSTILSKGSSFHSTVKKLTTSLEKISQILNTTLDVDDTLELILNDLKQIVSYDKALIVFLEGDNLVVKSSRNLIDSINKYGRTMNGASHILNKMKHHNANTEIISNSSKSAVIDLVKGFGLNIELPFSHITAPLTIRETLFGLIILIKDGKEGFSNEDVKIAEAFTGSAAYSIKDAELSNVFKMQLKVLKENVIERTKALEVIKEQNVKILEADRMKNEFLANISHELRTPLNAIIGFSEALKLKIFGSLNEKQEEYIDDIHTSGVHLLGMINDLLDLSKIEAKEMQIYKKKFSVYPAICEVLNIIRAIADKRKITVEVICEDKNMEIFADYRKFQQILYNLLSNAVKFSHEAGKIEINAGKLDDNLKLYVKDKGIGIDPKFHEKIFYKFQQVDNSYARKQGSTGLGLTITKELVEMHGGKIWVESEVDKGAAFYFILPMEK